MENMQEAIEKFAAKDPEETRKIFNEAIAKETDPDRIADLEIIREYLTNPKFKTSLQNFVSEITDLN